MEKNQRSKKESREEDPVFPVSQIQSIQDPERKKVPHEERRPRRKKIKIPRIRRRRKKIEDRKSTTFFLGSVAEFVSYIIVDFRYVLCN